MGKTSMILDSETQSPSRGVEEKVGIQPCSAEAVQTVCGIVKNTMFPIRVSKGNEIITLLLNTQQLEKQRKVEEINDLIRRRLRS